MSEKYINRGKRILKMLDTVDDNKEYNTFSDGNLNINREEIEPCNSLTDKNSIVFTPQETRNEENLTFSPQTIDQTTCLNIAPQNNEDNQPADVRGNLLSLDRQTQQQDDELPGPSQNISDDQPSYTNPNLTASMQENSSLTSTSSSSRSSPSSSSETSSSSSENDESYGLEDSLQDPLYKNESHSSDTSEEVVTEDEIHYEDVQQKKKRKVINHTEVEKKGKKKKKNAEGWQKTRAKILRNKGEAYVSAHIQTNEDGTKTKVLKERPKKSILPPCGEKCRLKCFGKISEVQRQQIFSEYYSFGNIEKQREYIASNMTSINPKYEYSNVEYPRNPNNAFHLILSGTKIRICKQFFMATLAINNRIIQTVVQKQKNCETGKVIELDKRGKHRNHKKVDENIKNKIRKHISSIPRIESHYCRSRTKKEYIEGVKSLTDLHRDYVELSKEEKHDYGNYQLYSKIFDEEYNISFHLPKKDQCELCLEYENATEEEKKKIEEKYNLHIKEKELSRIEKKR